MPRPAITKDLLDQIRAAVELLKRDYHLRLYCELIDRDFQDYLDEYSAKPLDNRGKSATIKYRENTDAGEDWITVNGTHIPLDDEGNAVGGPDALEGKNFSEAKSEQSESAETKNQVSPSAEGENEPCTGFASPQKRRRHFRDHGTEVGATSEEDYEQKGIDFLKQACGGDVIGYSTEEGKVVRFNTKTCEYASGKPGDTFYTYMSAKYDKKAQVSDPVKAKLYYERYKEKDGV